MTAMCRHRADPADLGPAVETQAFAGHRDERPVAAEPQVITELDGPVEKRPRLGLGDELEHLGDIDAPSEIACGQSTPVTRSPIICTTSNARIVFQPGGPSAPLWRTAA